MSFWKRCFRIDDKIGFLVAVLVLLLLFCILFPSWPPPNKELARRVICSAYLRSLGMAVVTYQENN
jgi:hypothetical protein